MFESRTGDDEAKMTIRSGGAIIDPEGNIFDTNGCVSHSEWLRKNMPEYAEYFKSLVKELPEELQKELLEMDEDDDSDLMFELDQKVLAKALENGWYRARVYDDSELTVQYGKGREPPSAKTIEKLLEAMKLSPSFPIKITKE